MSIKKKVDLNIFVSFKKDVDQNFWTSLVSKKKVNFILKKSRQCPKAYIKYAQKAKRRVRDP